MSAKEAKQLLKMCDKIHAKFLMEFGAYLIACAMKGRKPTEGCK